MRERMDKGVGAQDGTWFYQSIQLHRDQRRPPKISACRTCARRTEGFTVDLKLPIKIFDELSESVIESTGMLDLASGEIRSVEYEDYDVDTLNLPAEDETYEFTSGSLSNGKKDVEFRIEVDIMSGKYSVTPSELLELKGRAAKLFTAPPPGSQAPEPVVVRKGRARH